LQSAELPTLSPTGSRGSGPPGVRFPMSRALLDRNRRGSARDGRGLSLVCRTGGARRLSAGVRGPGPGASRSEWGAQRPVIGCGRRLCGRVACDARELGGLSFEPVRAVVGALHRGLQNSSNRLLARARPTRAGFYRGWPAASDDPDAHSPCRSICGWRLGTRGCVSLSASSIHPPWLASRSALHRPVAVAAASGSRCHHRSGRAGGGRGPGACWRGRRKAGDDAVLAGDERRAAAAAAWGAAGGDHALGGIGRLRQK